MHARRPTRLLILLVLWSAFAAPARAQTTGLIPINDLGSQTYAGFQGGLYPGGANAPPAAHLGWALVRSAEMA